MSSVWLDRFGTAASGACALHCATLALVPTVLPLMGLGLLRDERAEWLLLGIAILFAVPAAWLGYRTHHNRMITIGFAAGVLALVSARVAEALGLEGTLPVAVIGGGVVAVSHLANLRRTHTCDVESCATSSGH